LARLVLRDLKRPLTVAAPPFTHTRRCRTPAISRI
jgi:hypothetical protein